MFLFKPAETGETHTYTWIFTMPRKRAVLFLKEYSARDIENKIIWKSIFTAYLFDYKMMMLLESEGERVRDNECVGVGGSKSKRQ